MISVVFIGLSLAMDAFAISVTNGMSGSGKKLGQILLMSAYFGVFQFFMPLAGSFLTGMVSYYIESYGPYISFLLLAFIGVRMIIEAHKKQKKEADSAVITKLSHGRLLVLALATSIDALAVGVSFAFMEINIFIASVLIGVITFFVSTLGGLIGGRIPGLSGKAAETAAGVVLVVIGVKILIDGIT